VPSCQKEDGQLWAKADRTRVQLWRHFHLERSN
jgi:hypothetical protein